MKLKGHTLVELMVYVCLIGILCSFQIGFITREFKKYINNSEDIKSNLVINDSLNVIEKYIDEYSGFQLQDNTIFLSDYKNTNIKKILLDDDKIYIISYENGTKWIKKASNVLLKGVKNCKIQRKNSIILITLEDKKGKVTKRFIPVEK
ncbi:hypothetical protein ACER0A_007520 [Haloimpatiens sp. FM7315]|uniref:hypothetical protein n=1 Tax=Haloimpatiens sp. FM7315 TaxID=3298609 RepID=UPI00370ADC2C